ncbi:MAG TPA: hypothetical protein VFN91_16525, partial [Myxococcaceae bacterium]|nr:hypothetical protein [Myxococcaceae bacterium]
MRHAWVFLTVLGTGAGTLAQDRPGPGEILIDSTGPDAYHERRTVPLPPAGPERDAFLKDFLRVDPRDNRVTDRSGTVSATDFYTRLQRADLVAQAEDRRRQRIWLMAGGGAVAIASTIVGLVVMSSAPNSNAPGCVTDVFTQNACLDASSKRTTSGVLILAAGLTLGAGLFTWGASVPEMVTTPDETVRLATDYNLGLARKHGAAGARLQLVPTLAPGH